jgi:hypothetical protein
MRVYPKQEVPCTSLKVGCKASVDGNDFRVETPSGLGRKYYSHKLKKSGLRYEVAISIQARDIVWINGPFPCGKWPDIKIFRKDLIKMIQFGEAVEADTMACRYLKNGILILKMKNFRI